MTRTARRKDVKYATPQSHARPWQERLLPAETPTNDIVKYRATCEDDPEEPPEQATKPDSWEKEDRHPFVVDPPTTTASTPPQPLKSILKKVTFEEVDGRTQRGQEVYAGTGDRKRSTVDLSAEVDEAQRRAAARMPYERRPNEPLTQRAGVDKRRRRRSSGAGDGRRMGGFDTQEEKSRKDAEAVYDDSGDDGSGDDGSGDDECYRGREERDRRPYLRSRQEIKSEQPGERDKAASSGVSRRGEDQARDGRQGGRRRSSRQKELPIARRGIMGGVAKETRNRKTLLPPGNISHWPRRRP